MLGADASDKSQEKTRNDLSNCMSTR